MPQANKKNNKQLNTNGNNEYPRPFRIILDGKNKEKKLINSSSLLSATYKYIKI